MQRRERTHRLIELGGLVQKSGLANLADDDRATIYGALLTLADSLVGADAETTRVLWRRRGQRAFAAEQQERSPPPSEAADA